MSKLTEILSELYECSYMTAVHDERETGKEIKDPMTVEKAQKAILAWVDEAIGKDETSLDYDSYTPSVVWQNANRIRAQQRKRAGL